MLERPSSDRANDRAPAPAPSPAPAPADRHTLDPAIKASEPPTIDPLRRSGARRWHIERRRASAIALVTIVAVIVVARGALLIFRSPSALGRLFTGSLLARLSTAPAADGTSPVERAPAADPVRFLEFVVGDIQDAWQDQFARAGLAYERTQLVLFRDIVRSGCGRASAETGPFYCPVDARVYLDLTFFDQMVTQLRAPGDFAEAYVVAHEFGHHVQSLLGITGQVARISSAEPQIANDLSVRTELQADCLAGIWGHTAYEQERLEPGDLEEAVRAAEAVGDDRLQRQADGRVDPDTFTHGTSEQRSRWFLAGFQSGDPSTCDTFQRDAP
jgi:uncharacterized protein